MNRFITIAFFAFVFSQLALSSAAAQEFYLSTELGLSFGSSMETKSHDTDLPTLCDNILDPNRIFLPANEDGTGPAECVDSLEFWGSKFDGATGILAGAALGYRASFGGRLEIEYFRLGHNYSQESDVEGQSDANVDKQEQELVRSVERIGRVNIDSLFVNAYYDLPVSSLKWRPYVGGGAGVGIARIGYDSVWARNIDPDRISTADEAYYNADADAGNDEDAARRALHEKIAGTTTTASKTLRDTVFGFQAVIGVDYLISEKTSLGIKGRWVGYSNFKDSGNEWDQLRSHESHNGPGTGRVVYRVETDDLSAFGINLVMSYAF